MGDRDRFFYEHLGFYFHVLSKQYHQCMVREMEPWEMERAFLPLLLIDDNHGCINQHDLSKTLYLDKVSTNRIIQYLTTSGWINKKVCAADKRKTLLEITPAGKKLLAPIRQSIDKTNGLFLEKLNENERTQLFQLIDKMIINIEDIHK